MWVTESIPTPPAPTGTRAAQKSESSPLSHRPQRLRRAHADKFCRSFSFARSFPASIRRCASTHCPALGWWLAMCSTCSLISSGSNTMSQIRHTRYLWYGGLTSSWRFIPNSSSVNGPDFAMILSAAAFCSCLLIAIFPPPRPAFPVRTVRRHPLPPRYPLPPAFTAPPDPSLHSWHLYTAYGHIVHAPCILSTLIVCNVHATIFQFWVVRTVTAAFWQG